MREEFSPHAWGWTDLPAANHFKDSVFPTRVGVDRFFLQGRADEFSFPHTRGGGPCQDGPQPSLQQFSPHAWGWTAFIGYRDEQPVVFPTRVGVDRRSSNSSDDM